MKVLPDKALKPENYDTCLDPSVDRSRWNNLRFYVAMRLTGLPVPSVRKVAEIELSQASNSVILLCINEVWKHYSEMGGTDQIAKGTKLADQVSASHRASPEAEIHASNEPQKS